MEKVKTIFISDVHLGTRSCKDDSLISFLKYYSPEKLILVGDIIDGWRMKSSLYWTNGHNKIIKQILKMSKNCEVIYVTGNHDEFLRDYTPFQLGGISIMDSYIHNGDTLVIHGDEFDGIIKYHKWLAFLGDISYTLLLRINVLFNKIRHKFGFGYWSLSSYLKYKVKSAVNFIYQFEDSVSAECDKKGYKRVICGHIHHAEIKKIGKIEYCNCGDWVESCTAIVERKENQYEIVRWEEMRKEKK